MQDTFIVSVAPASSGLFRQELKQDPQAALLEPLDEWRWLCRFPPASDFLFVLHRFAVERQVELSQLELDLVLANLLDFLGERAFADRPYGIQVAANLRIKWSFAQLVEELIRKAELPAETFSPRSPEQVLSVYLHGTKKSARLFAGVSSVEQNLSVWSGGQCRMPRDPDAVSRAEAKLLEGWEAFGLDSLRPGLALDLGAAPGGWSRVLVNLGYEVHAVDPAPLVPQVASRVHFHQQTAGGFLATPGPKFDFLVCDMKMEALKMAELLLAFAPRLQPGAKLFATLKLGKGDQGLAEAQQALAKLRGGYRLEAARQLFFNRSELSVVLSNPS